ncbi:hypothetical protein PGB90_007017 [Kerria lacca]
MSFVYIKSNFVFVSNIRGISFAFYKTRPELKARTYTFTLFYMWLDVSVFAISCNDILRDGSIKDFSRDDLITLSSSTPQQLETCLFLLGKDEIDFGRANILWTTIKQVYGSVEDIPEDTLKQLGWIISGITADDFYNISISDIDTVSVFGIYRNLSLQQLTALKQTTENQWSRKGPEQLTSYDLVALRQILCAFNDSEIGAIHSDSYRDAANELATLYNCPKSALIQLVNLATDETAFGKPQNWNAIQVTSIGCVMAGLSSAAAIPAESMEGITPEIVKCLPSSFIKTMSESQLQHFTTSAASALSSSQQNVLTSDQKYALELAVKGLRYMKRSLSENLHSRFFQGKALHKTPKQLNWCSTLNLSPDDCQD